MLRSARGALLALTLLAPAVLPLYGCQKASDTDETLNVDDFVDTTSPDSVNAEQATDGRTYRVVRGNNQPDEILTFDWHTQFPLSITLNNNSTKDSIDVDFPARISAATIKVEQASGGIVSPPTGGEVEHYDSVTSQVSGNQFGGANSTISMVFDVWYDLPSLRKEALVTVTLSFVDDSNKTWSKVVRVKVNP